MQAFQKKDLPSGMLGSRVYTIFFISIFIGLNQKGYAQNAIKDSTTNNHYLLEMDIIAPFLSSFTLGMEFSRGKNYSVRADMGYFRRGSTEAMTEYYDYGIGGFGRLGFINYLKPILGKDKKKQQALIGPYFGLDFLAQYMEAKQRSLLRIGYQNGIIVNGSAKEVTLGVSSIIGRQYQLSRKFYLDIFMGIGLGYQDILKKNDYGERYFEDELYYDYILPVSTNTRGFCALFEGGFKLCYLVH